MGFHENAIFPETINYKSRGGPASNTDIIVLDSGSEERNPRWNGAKRHYDAVYDDKEHDQLSTLLDFYIARMGPAYGFRFKDWSDYTTAANHRDDPTPTDQLLGIGDGVTVDFQFIKRYSSGGVIRVRNIRKPIADTSLLSLNDVTLADVNWSINTATGLVTLNTPPALGVEVKGGLKFHVPVRFGEEIDQEAMKIAIDDHGWGSIPNIPIVEDFDGEPISDEYEYGGSSTYDPMVADQTWVPNNGRVIVLNPSVNNRKFKMPNPVGYQSGAPWVYVTNISLTNNVLIRTYLDVALGTLGPGVTAQMLLAGTTWIPAGL